ncbi:hypothetical protein SNEBB_004793 [Seison nebaliae]|nr:hypothetical protein SNEBB_004793 [Seison nebaliae]
MFQIKSLKITILTNIITLLILPLTNLIDGAVISGLLETHAALCKDVAPQGFHFDMIHACTDRWAKERSFIFQYPDNKIFQVVNEDIMTGKVQSNIDIILPRTGIKLPNKGTMKEVGCHNCRKCYIWLYADGFFISLRCLDRRIQSTCVTINTAKQRPKAIKEYDKSRVKRKTIVLCNEGTSFISYVEPENITVTVTSPTMRTTALLRRRIRKIEKQKIRKRIFFIAKTSKVENIKKDFMRRGSTSLLRKKQICQNKMEFNNFTDINDFKWHVESTKFINGSADDKYILCEVELSTSIIVEDEESLKLALQPTTTFVGFKDSIELTNISEKLYGMTNNKQSFTALKTIITVSVILFIVLIILIVVRVKYRTPKKKITLKLSINNQTMVEPHSASTEITTMVDTAKI